METATSISLSAKLIHRNQPIYTFQQVPGSLISIFVTVLYKVSTRAEVHSQLNQLRKKNDNALVITGQSLEVSTFSFNNVLYFTQVMSTSL